MIRLALFVTCYNADASFAYNPISRQGFLIANYISVDDYEANDLCNEFDGHLVRVEITLANVQDNTGSIAKAPNFAYS